MGDGDRGALGADDRHLFLGHLSVGISVEYFLRRLIPILVLAYVLFATRRRPGRRYVKKPPTKADADLDNWTGWG